MLRFSVTGTYPELQFENLTEQLALAHLKADAGEAAKLRGRIAENLALLPTNIPEIRPHPHLTATQIMFVRTLRKAILQKAEITSLDALRQPPFSIIGDPEQLFKKTELDELIDLAQSLAA